MREERQQRYLDDQGAEVRREIECVTCGARWTEVFTLEKFCGLRRKGKN